MLLGCSTPRVAQSAPKIGAPLLAPGQLEANGIAFLTPTTGPGQEHDKNALALLFAGKLSEMRPAVRVVPLSETLGAVNRAGLARQYQRMYDGFDQTGVLDRGLLAKLRGVTGARHFALLQLGDFRRDPLNGPSLLGIQMQSGRSAQIRLFLQVWDSFDGTIAWEGINEVSHTENSGTQRAVTFTAVVEHAARELIVRLP